VSAPKGREVLLMRVLARRRQRSSVSIARADDFLTADAVTCDSCRVLGSLDVSLYCLDTAARRAIFVRADPDRLAGAAFLYQAQAAHARALVSVPFEVLHDLADSVSLDATRLAFVHSTGRCGSTLVSRVLGSLPNVTSLSEPDAFTNIVPLAVEGGASAVELRRLLRSCLLLQIAPYTCRPAPHLVVVKFRSFVACLAEALHEALPQAQTVFLYRHAAGYFRSAAAIVGQHRREELSAPAPPMLAAMRRWVPMLDELARSRGATPSTAEVIVCMWASAMQSAIGLIRKDRRTFTIRYEDLRKDTLGALNSLFSFMEVDGRGNAGLDAILAEDSQAGTALERAKMRAGVERLSEGALEVMLSSLAVLAPWLAPDTCLPLQTASQADG
jgi:hypothetical protein